MKKLIIILSLLLVMTSCGITYEEAKIEKQQCEELWYIYEFFDTPFWYSSTCSKEWYNANYNLNEIDLKQIDFCWDWLIKCKY